MITLRKSDTWKMQLRKASNFISSKDNDEERAMHPKSENTEITSHYKGDEAVEELFESLLSRYQIVLELSMKGSEFIFDSVSLLYYRCHGINFNHGGSYIGSLDWIKNKAIISPINKNDYKCFQHGLTMALNHEEMEKDSQRLSKIKLL